MSKMKELDEIAERIAEVSLELIDDSTHWQLYDYREDGDELHQYVIAKAIEKMYLRTQHNL